MKGVLVWKDGTHEATPCAGGLFVMYPRRVPGGFEEVRFEHTATDGDVMTYTEVSRRDITAQMAEARRAIDERRDEILRRGLATYRKTGGSLLTRMRRKLAAWVEPSE